VWFLVYQTDVMLTPCRHGPLSNCPISATESLVSEYMNLDENSVERVRIERQYGKAVILRLLAKYEEEKSNTEWFKSSTMPCPGCRVNVEKSIGCNHVRFLSTH
jgi:E3 ubiquitin-protein ligase RNF14